MAAAAMQLNIKTRIAASICNSKSYPSFFDKVLLDR
jgi:5-enolpyruvylshikimate-3-phosphate synthase